MDEPLPIQISPLAEDRTTDELGRWLAERVRQDSQLAETFQKLSSAFPGQPVWIKGGWVRDTLLGRKPNDIDVEVDGESVERVKETLARAFVDRVSQQGRRVPILVVRNLGEPELQVVVRRKDDDPLLADFTCNALRFDLRSSRLHDPHRGLECLRAGRLRLIPQLDLKTTPSQFFRAVAMAARFPEFEIEAESMARLREVVRQRWDVAVPGDFKSLQVRKALLEGSRPSRGLRLLRETGWLARETPELHRIWETPQDPLHHPEGDVGVHTEMVLDQAAALMRRSDHTLSDQDKTVLMLAALLHDIGKAATTEKRPAPAPRGFKITSYDHENVGVPLANEFMKRMGFGARIRKQVKALVAVHMLPNRLHRDLTRGGITQERFDNEVRKIVRRIAPASFRALLTFTEADFRGRGTDKSKGAHGAGETFAESVLRNGFDRDPKARLLNQPELVRLGIDSDFAAIFQEIESRRDAGKLRTKDQAIRFVKYNYFLTDKDLADAGITAGEERGRVYIALKQGINDGQVHNRKDALELLHRSSAVQSD